MRDRDGRRARLLGIGVSTVLAISPIGATLEDFYGDTGTRFQAAVVFYNREPLPSSIPPNVSGYGFGIDDMFVSWKETRLDEDATDCAGSGECADLEVNTTLSYESSSFVEITVTDKTPYDPVNPKNDCNGNGGYGDAGDDQDCNDNGTLDVTVRLTSLAEPLGEIAVIDQIPGGAPAYKARFPYSSAYDSPGSVFVQADGTANPVITATYDDRDDGTGSRCRNALDPAQQGFLQAATTVTVVAGRIDFKTYAIVLAPSSPGDDDGSADANETIDLAVTFINKSGLDLDDLVAALSTTDPEIECISKPIVAIGSVLANATVVAPPFRFKVAGPPLVDRTTVEEVLQAAFTITLRSNKFDFLTRPLDLAIDLDLNALGSAAVSPFIEDFEGAGLGLFTLQTLDAGKNTLALSDGHRCQYSDPFGINSNSPNRQVCFLGFTSDPPAGVNDWHITGTCDQRAYTGSKSLAWNFCTTGFNTTGRFKQLDAVRTIDPINLPLPSGNPELTFKHQVSFVDNRGIGGIDSGEVADRGVVHVQLADGAGNPVGNWIKIVAYENDYEQQGTDDFTNCTFDPIDDGNDEDDFFDPLDPLRRLGPSSTCFPEFVYSRSGSTDWRLDFNAANVNLAQGPGLPGNQGAGFRNPGTWVQPKFNLIGYAGRSVRLRFLGTSIELADSQGWNDFLPAVDHPADDGWWIDDVRVESALSEPLTISVDTAAFTGAACPVCSSITPILTAAPAPPLAGPGQIVTVNARDSTIDACNSGTAQYQFWIDANANGIVGDGGDTLLRDWTDNSQIIDAPQVTTRYGVAVRCSTATSCDTGPGDNPGNATVLIVAVNCPSTGNAKAPFPQVIGVDKTSVHWPSSSTVDVVRGDLIALRASGGNYTGTVSTCLGGDNVTGTLVADATSPFPGGGFYYLVRPTTVAFCNQTPGYTTNHVREAPGRDTEINADGASCP